MDPITTAAIMGLMGKVIGVGADLYNGRGSRGQSAIAIGMDGSSYALDRVGRVPVGLRTSFNDPVPFVVDFAPSDDWAEEALSGDMPVVVVIEDLDPRSPLDSVMEVLALDDALEGALYPSQYALTAFVFSRTDPDDWDEDDLIGGGRILFSVSAGEPPFHLGIAIESFEVPAIFEVGHIERGGLESYEIELDAGQDYGIFVAPDDERADLDLTIRDENRNIVDNDYHDDSAALCFVTPAWSGAFELNITCSKHSTDYVLMIGAVG